MFRMSVNLHAVPHNKRGTFYVYATSVVYDDESKAVVAFEIGSEILTGMPEMSSTTPVTEYTAEWADIFYQFATRLHAKSVRPDDGEVNARPADTSTN